MWQAELELPAGWRRQSAAMPRQACLDAITGAWPDITPASARAGAPEGRPAPAGSAAAGSAPGEATPDERRRHPVQHSRDVRFAHELVAGQASRRPGSAAVIAADDQVADIAAMLAKAGLPHSVLDADAVAGQLTLVPVTIAKGLEFDQVIVVEPTRIAAAESRGLHRLYVALTRAVSRLTVLHAEPLPAPLR